MAWAWVRLVLNILSPKASLFSRMHTKDMISQDMILQFSLDVLCNLIYSVGFTEIYDQKLQWEIYVVEYYKTVMI